MADVSSVVENVVACARVISAEALASFAVDSLERLGLADDAVNTDLPTAYVYSSESSAGALDGVTLAASIILAVSDASAANALDELVEAASLEAAVSAAPAVLDSVDIIDPSEYATPADEASVDDADTEARSPPVVESPRSTVSNSVAEAGVTDAPPCVEAVESPSSFHVIDSVIVPPAAAVYSSLPDAAALAPEMDALLRAPDVPSPVDAVDAASVMSLLESADALLVAAETDEYDATSDASSAADAVLTPVVATALAPAFSPALDAKPVLAESRLLVVPAVMDASSDA